MKNTYEYYLKIIKPIEKKYTKMCILYSIFKFKILKNKMDFYNKILIRYYIIIQNDEKEYIEFENNLF